MYRLLQFGFVDPVQELLSRPEVGKRLLKDEYHRLMLLVAVAEGDYDEAMKQLSALEQWLQELWTLKVLSGSRLQFLGVPSAYQSDNEFWLQAASSANLEVSSAHLQDAASLASASSTLGSQSLFESGINLVKQRSEYLCILGLLAVEKGWVNGIENTRWSPQTDRNMTAELFREAVAIDAESPYRSLASRYYQLLTGKPLPAN
jgi:hypothetical protein